MSRQPKGDLIIIGGHEDKEGEQVILKEVAKRVTRRGRSNGHSHNGAGHGSLVITTVASRFPQALAEEYKRVFRNLGVTNIDVVEIETRAEAHHDANVEKIRKASVVFFTGGDQLRISSQIGDSPTYQCLLDLYQDGGTIVGTSAGAAVMSETMIIQGSGDETNEIYTLGMAPGLGLVENIVIDSHFAERGRMGRLLGAVAENPKNLGICIDEDTAIIVEQGKRFKVIGSGGVYVVDGSTVSYSSLSDARPEGVLSIYGVTVHVLGTDDRFDIVERQPIISPSAQKQIA